MRCYLIFEHLKIYNDEIDFVLDQDCSEVVAIAHQIWACHPSTTADIYEVYLDQIEYFVQVQVKLLIVYSSYVATTLCLLAVGFHHVNEWQMRGPLVGLSTRLMIGSTYSIGCDASLLDRGDP
jgi:hypothetical protein